MSNRFLLDTNILVFLLTKNNDELSSEVRYLISDYGNILYANSIAILELLQLYRIGRVRFKKGQSTEDVFNVLENELGVNIVSYDLRHIKSLSSLEIIKGHNDPFDHAIISQVITGRYILISSDRKFKHYQDQGLVFVFNKR